MGECSPARRFSGEGVQRVDGKLALVMNGGKEVVYGVQQTTAISNLWSSMTCVSRGDDEVRLEATAASVVVGELEKLREKAGQGYQSTFQREGRREREFEGRGGGFTASESTTSSGRTCELQRGI
jgi:hypothetical protein